MNQKPKLYRDPVHNIITLRKENAADMVIQALIETPEMQRLRRIRQLGFSNLVYHGAEHSRFVHSMGVCAMAQQMYDHLRPNGPDEERLIVMAAALCHDLGHGPFSHVMERISQIHHEDITIALITTPGTGVHKALSRYDSQLPGRVADFYQTTTPRNPLHDIVSSQLDADRIDYILRDGRATGVKIGTFDLERILTMLEEHDGHICVNFRAVEAVEGYLLARFHMYKQVYLHRASRAAERMLEAIVRRARALCNEGHSFNWFPSGALATLIRGELTEKTQMAAIDDTDIWFALKQWTKDSDSILAELSNGLLMRQLFKTIVLPDGDEGEQRIEDAKKRALKLGFDPDYHVLIDSSAETPYKPYVPGDEERNDHIRMVSRNGSIVPIEQVSDVVQLLGQLHYQVRRLVVPAALASNLTK